MSLLETNNTTVTDYDAVAHASTLSSVVELERIRTAHSTDQTCFLLETGASSPDESSFNLVSGQNGPVAAAPAGFGPVLNVDVQEGTIDGSIYAIGEDACQPFYNAACSTNLVFLR